MGASHKTSCIAYVLRGRRIGVAAALLLALAAWSAGRQLAVGAVGPAAAASATDVVVAKDVMVPMRDGVRLAADVWRPARDGVALAGRFPVVLERTPYGKGDSEWWALDFARRGYVA